VIWLAFAVLALLAIVVVLPPLVRRAPDAARATEIAVYAEQLKEVDADLERGLISAAEAEAARTEIKRRILAVPQATSSTSVTTPSRTLALATGAVLIAASLGTYLALGRPALPSQFYNPEAERQADGKQMLAEVEAMVARLAERLKAEPNNPQGWRMLGWSYVQLGRVKDGIDALARAITLDPENAALRAQYGEALVQDADGQVTPGAIAAFDEALKRDPKDPRASFYKGLALVQSGKDKEALALWLQIIREAPADADWLPGLRTQAQELAKKLNLDPKTTVP
jgi:cytochrome c-type biogenesis protein CcmH